MPTIATSTGRTRLLLLILAAVASAVLAFSMIGSASSNDDNNQGIIDAIDGLTPPHTVGQIVEESIELARERVEEDYFACFDFNISLGLPPFLAEVICLPIRDSGLPEAQNRQGDRYHQAVLDVLAIHLSHHQPTVQDVDIDIKPGSGSNSINPKSKGVIPIAISGGASLDLDLSTIEFGPDGATLVHQGHVDGDDLILHFRTQETGIQKGDTEACITGQTTSGTDIEGCDSIKTVGK